MKSFTKKLEKMFTAITFAEAGELDTARQIMNGQESAAKDSRTEDSRVMSHAPRLTTDSVA